MNSQQVSEYMDLTASAVQNLFRRGRIVATKDIDGRWQTTRQAVDAYLVKLENSSWITRINFDDRLSAMIAEQKIKVSYGMNQKLSARRSKFGNIPSFDLFADRISCQHIKCNVCKGSTALCRSSCYAKKPQGTDKGIGYSLAVRANRIVNTYMSVYHLDLVESQLSQWLNGHSEVQLFRIHSAGDMLSQAYLEMWKRIAAYFPAVKFMSFTKRFFNGKPTLDFGNCPENFQVIWSVFPDSSTPPNGVKAFCVYDSDSDNQYSQDIQSIIDNSDLTIPCSGQCTNCGVCWYLSKLEKNVYFHIH